jgi:signal transduction histidine kinase
MASSSVAPYSVHAQTKLIDSLNNVIARADKAGKQDSTLLAALIDVAFEYRLINPDHALKLTQRAATLALALHDEINYGTAINIIGIVYLNKGFHTIAQDYLQQSLAIRERIGDTLGMASSLNNLGLVYRYAEQYNKALAVYRRVLTMYRQLANVQGQANAYTNVGVVYLSLELHDSALANHQRAKALYEQIKDSVAIARACTNLGAAYKGKGRLDSALSYLFLSLPVMQRNNNKRGQMLALFGIAKAYERAANTPQAISYALASLVLADTLQARMEQRDCYKLLVSGYLQTNATAQAQQYFQRFVQLNDTLTRQRNTQIFAEMQTRFETVRKDKEINLLQRDREIQRLELSRQQILRNVLIVGLIVLMALVVLGVQRYRYKQHTERTLRQKNEELQAANTEILRQQRILEDQATEIELTNTELLETNLRLQALNDEKNEFLGIAAHDLKNPLSSIRMSADMMLRYHEKMNKAQQQERLQVIVSVAERMMTIITNLLDVNAIEAGKFTFTFQSIDVVALVAQILGEYTEQASKKDITLTLETEPLHNSTGHTEAPITVWADVTATTEIIENLLSNAVKYSPLHSSVRVRVLRKELVGRIEIQDEGSGISVEDQKKLFGKFVRLSAQPTGGEHSTGLGLSIVKKLVEAMKGRVWCESEPENGRTGAMFVVELPLELPVELSMELPAAQGEC